MYGVPGYSKKMKNGGPVVGPGTGTSDSIKTQVPEGSYIMPADSTEALGFGQKAQGKPKGAASQQPGHGMPGYRKQVPVNLSNGEFELPPEQVHAVGVQALEQAKAATHTPVPGYGFNPKAMRERSAQQEQQGFGMRRPEQFFANGGLVEDPEKKLGLGPNAQGNNPARAAAMQEQFKQPVTGPQGVVNVKQPPTAPAPAQPGALDVPMGLGRAAIGALSVPIAAGKDAIRYGAAYAVGGDPSTLEGGSSKYRDQAMGEIDQGLSQARAPIDRLRESGREALGVQPAQEAGAPASSGPATRQPNTAGRAGAQGAEPQNPASGLGWRRTGIGADRQGGEIAGRMGAGGVPEFTNEAATPGAVSGAVPGEGMGFGHNSQMARAQSGDMTAPAGSRVLASGTNAPRGDAEFARLGSAANIGNGLGTFSQGEPGDAQMAMERFERANKIRGESIANRPRELGDAGGRVTVVADSSRTPTLRERMLSRLESRQAQTDALRAQTQQQGALTGQRMNTEQLQQQRLQQELATGQMGLEDRQRRADLEAQLSDPNLPPEQRAQLEETYYALNTQAKDRYMTVEGGTGEFGAKMPSRVLDRRTGRYIDEQGEAQSQALPAGVTLDSAMAEAKAAIDSGVPREAVNQRLQQWGLDPL